MAEKIAELEKKLEIYEKRIGKLEKLLQPKKAELQETKSKNENDLTSDFSTFVSFFRNLAETHIAIIFPEEESATTPKEVIKDLYRQGFFKAGKSLKESRCRLEDLGFHWDVPRIAHTLEYWSKGKKAFLTRSGKKGDYKYFERFPPDEFFRTII